LAIKSANLQTQCRSEANPKDGFNLKGVSRKLYMNDGLRNCPLTSNDTTKHANLNSICHLQVVENRECDNTNHELHLGQYVMEVVLKTLSLEKSKGAIALV
jgi:hypothetical protein